MTCSPPVAACPPACPLAYHTHRHTSQVNLGLVELQSRARPFVGAYNDICKSLKLRDILDI
jgi:hypothetical protein